MMQRSFMIMSEENLEAKKLNNWKGTRYDEIMANSIKQSTQQKGKKKEQRGMTRVKARRDKAKVGH
jgi:hypothetical protein